jgi:hypothetical protein
MSLSEISALLKKNGFFNPVSGRAWSRDVVRRDVRWLEAEYRRDSVRDLSDHKAEFLGRYRELFRKAVRADNLPEARLLLGDMRKLLGADAPEVFVFEQLESRMLEALEGLREEFGGEKEVWSRILGVLSELDGGGGDLSSGGGFGLLN